MILSVERCSGDSNFEAVFGFILMYSTMRAVKSELAASKSVQALPVVVRLEVRM